MRRLGLLFAAVLFAVLVIAQTVPQQPAQNLDYYCPMDPDVRAAAPGKCPRCGMMLRVGVPDPIEYPLDITLSPRVPKPGERLDFTFRIRDPRKNTPVTKFETVHEKLFHLFIVSQDLDYFVHDHPVPQPGGAFTYEATLPKRGLYRVLGDYYPTGGMPQLTERTIIVPGGHLETTRLSPDLAPKHTANMDVELVTEPAQPLAGFKTLLFFRVKPSDGLEQYLGAWGHMLAASDDLIDLIHTHPFLADGGPQIQFNVIFPRARTYRLWVQFQRKGEVNTAVFTVPVQELK
jgi:hypothetical protein